MTQTLRPRAIAIIYRQESDQTEALVMMRRKEGTAYATLVGGGIEPEETPAEACAREVMEEVNLKVNVGKLIARYENMGNDEHYFLCHIENGEMRLGDGPEGIRNSEENWYEPRWIPLNELETINLLPTEARTLLREHAPVSC